MQTVDNILSINVDLVYLVLLKMATKFMQNGTWVKQMRFKCLYFHTFKGEVGITLDD